MGTALANAIQARDGLYQEIQRLKETTLSPMEIESTQRKLLGQYELGKQTNAQIAQIYGWYETLGLGLDFDQNLQRQIRAVTPELLQATAQTRLNHPHFSFVGPEETLAELMG